MSQNPTTYNRHHYHNLYSLTMKMLLVIFAAMTDASIEEDLLHMKEGVILYMDALIESENSDLPATSSIFDTPMEPLEKYPCLDQWATFVKKLVRKGREDPAKEILALAATYIYDFKLLNP